jgi:YVTN family beta-propeller protein
LALTNDGRWLFTANRRSGSISTIDTDKRQVSHEISVGKTLSDICLTRDGRFLLAVDEEAHELVLFARTGAELSLAGRLRVSPYPVSVRVSGDGSHCFVASLWSRRLTIVRLDLSAERKSPAMSAAKVLDLPFAPRVQQLVRDDAHLLVADSFGGRLAIVDVKAAKLTGVRTLPAHNIRGLAVSHDGKKLLVAHQILNDLAETTHNDVHWGVLLSNVLRWIVLDRVISGQGHILEGAYVNMTGDTQSAGGDPSAVAITPDGEALIAIAGMDELGMGRDRDYSLTRVSVGKRPVALAISPDGRTAYVANQFSDSVSVVDLATASMKIEISLGPTPELSQIDRGEVLFHNARLSLDGWMSCHSCHTDGHTNGLLNDNLGDGTFGAAKRVLSLLGVAETKPWAWNGQVASLEEQVRKSITTTMQGERPRDADVRALTAYLEGLKPAPPLGPLRGVDAAAVARGRQIFQDHRCESCHAPPSYTSAGRFDVGLSDTQGRKEFNPPSLRGVSQREPYFHDNSAATLREVFTKHRHMLESDLTEREIDSLLAFLESL